MSNTTNKNIGKVVIKNVRLSFANLWEPVAKFGGDPKYDAAFIIDPDSIDGSCNLRRIEAVVRQLENQSFGGMEMPDDLLPLKDGNSHDYDGWADMTILSSSSRARPGVLDRGKRPVQAGEPGAPYSGCNVDAVIKLWAMDNDYGKRICARLLAVRFRNHGEPFAGSGFDDDDFDDLEDLDDDECEI